VSAVILGSSVSRDLVALKAVKGGRLPYDDAVLVLPKASGELADRPRPAAA